MDRKTYVRDVYSQFWITAREKCSFSHGYLEYEKNLCNYICEHVPKGGKLLGVAIGMGYPFEDFLQRKGYSVCGIDIAPCLIEKCRQLYPKIDCKVGDAEDIDFSDDHFDCVYCFSGSFLIPNLNKAIDEMLRVTRRGGACHI